MHLMALRIIEYIEQYVLCMSKLERLVCFCYLGLHHGMQGSMSIGGGVGNTASKNKHQKGSPSHSTESVSAPFRDHSHTSGKRLRRCNQAGAIGKGHTFLLHDFHRCLISSDNHKEPWPLSEREDWPIFFRPLCKLERGTGVCVRTVGRGLDYLQRNLFTETWGREFRIANGQRVLVGFVIPFVNQQRAGRTPSRQGGR